MLRRLKRMLAWIRAFRLRQLFPFEWEDIMRDGALYLHRLHLMEWKKRRFLFWHEFYRGDEDPDPHDHPWWFISFVWSAGYDDEQYELRDGKVVLVRVQRCKPFRFYFRKATHLHRVRMIPGRPKAKTLVILGPKVRDWGFQTAKGWVLSSIYTGRAS